MSMTPDFMRGLDELVRIDLQRLRDSYFYWLLISTGVVILGVLLEGPELVWEVREVFRERKFPKNIELLTPIPERHTPAWIISISLAGWLLVCLGVGGEGIFEGYVSAADGLLQTFNNMLLTDASDRASKAEITAKAFESQIANANARAAVAIQSAEKEKLARVKIEQEIADRHLSPNQRRTIGKMMLKFPPQAWQIVTFSGDGEAKGFSTDIEKALVGMEGAGWPTPYRSENQTGLPPRGILIEFGTNANAATLAAAKSLAEALSAEKVLGVDGPKPFAPPAAMQIRPGAFVSMNIGGGPDPSVPITVIIGRKP